MAKREGEPTNEPEQNVGHLSFGPLEPYEKPDPDLSYMGEEELTAKIKEFDDLVREWQERKEQADKNASNFIAQRDICTRALQKKKGEPKN